MPDEVADTPTEFLRHRALLRRGLRWLAPGARPVDERIAAYRPAQMSDAVWAAVASATREAVAAVEPSPERVTRFLNVASSHLAWAHRRGIELRPEVVWHVDVIEHSVVDGFGHLEGATQASYRSDLRTLGEAIAGPDACPTRQRIISRGNPETPYRSDELADLAGAVRGLTTPHRRENALIVVALGAGAGLTNGEINALVGTDVDTAHDSLVVTVSTRGQARQVPVRAEWEQAVVERAAQVGRNPMFRPDRTKIRALDIAKFLDSLTFAYLPRLTVQRLRVTWIVGQLDAGVPVQVVAAAAGVSASQIGRYVSHVAPIGDAEAARLLRGDGTAP